MEVADLNIQTVSGTVLEVHMLRWTANLCGCGHHQPLRLQIGVHQKGDCQTLPPSAAWPALSGW